MKENLQNSFYSDWQKYSEVTDPKTSTCFYRATTKLLMILEKWITFISIITFIENPSKRFIFSTLSKASFIFVLFSTTRERSNELIIQ